VRITLTQVGKPPLLRGTTTVLQVCEIRGYVGGECEERRVVECEVVQTGILLPKFRRIVGKF
jgi:hypothetical protein